MDLLTLKEKIVNLQSDNNFLVIGIDGLGGAGKSTISEELYRMLKNDKYNATLLHIDDFIHCRKIRYNDNYLEWECYYKLQWRYDYFLNNVIYPLRNSTEYCHHIELYDKANDTYFTKKVNFSIGSIVIVEGVFLQRPELKEAFDYVIYIDVSEKERLNRVLKRDSYIGNVQQIKEKYINRYFPAERFYIKNCCPVDRANYVIRGSE